MRHNLRMGAAWSPEMSDQTNFFLHGVKAKKLSFERHPSWKADNLKLKNLPKEVYDKFDVILTVHQR